MNEERVERLGELEKCQHFNGVQHKTCMAGVSYESKACKLPCLTIGMPIPIGERLKICPKLELQNMEQILARDKQIEESMAKHAKVTPRISQVKKEHKGEDWAGSFPCPVCGGTLRMSHSSYNGHVHGKCSGAGCVHWLE